MDQNLNPKSYRQPVEVTFTFPESMQLEVNHRSVTLRELKASAESRAIARANGDGGVLVQELVKEAIVGATDLDGVAKRISTADESIDAFMDAVGPKGRALLAQAYAVVNQPRSEDKDSFLGSASAVVR